MNIFVLSFDVDGFVSRTAVSDRINVAAPENHDLVD
jgi:hypothetical protein